MKKYPSMMIVALLLSAGQSPASQLIQTDWSGVVDAGPVEQWTDTYWSVSAVARLAVPGQLSLASAPLEAPVKHLIADGYPEAYGLAVADIDGNGHLDVLATTKSPNGLMLWLNEDGTGLRWTTQAVAPGFTGGTGVQVGDVDSDGDLDLVGSSQSPGSLAWWRNDGGTPITWTQFAIDLDVPMSCNLWLADMDSDGDLDVVSSGWTGGFVAWWRNDGGDRVRWSKEEITALPGAHSSVAGDLDGDGDLDVVATSGTTGRVMVCRNDGSGTWTTTALSPRVSGARYADVADLDGDGHLDVVATGFGGTVVWWRNVAGDASQWDTETISDEMDGGHFVVVRDVDGDGRQDVLMSDWADDTIAWFSLTDDGWEYHLVDGAFGGTLSALTGDLDGDGTLEVIGTAYGTGEIAWWEVNALAAAGQLESTVLDLGSTATLNAEWTATVPEGSEMVLKVRGGDDSSELGPWSAALQPPFEFTGGRYLQYRVELSSDGTDTPVLDEISFSKNTTPAAPGQHVAAIAAAARSAGAEGTTWVTDVALHNAGGADATANLFWLPRDLDNSGATAVQVTVLAASSVRLDDIVANLFGVDPGLGAILVGSDLPLEVSSRTYNLTAEGTYGQYIPGISLDRANSSGDRPVLLQLSHNDGYRTNLGFANLGSDQLDLTVDLHRGDGSPLGTTTVTLDPFASHQLDGLLRDWQPVDDAYAIVSSNSDDARFLTYASVVDCVSGDPIYISPSVPSEEGLWVPAAAHVQGVAGTNWRTDLELFSCGDSQARFQIEQHPPAGQPPVFTLDAGVAVRYGDVLGETLDTTGSKALQIRVLDGQVMVSSRTYNDLGDRTYGQFIPGTPASGAFAQGDEALLIQLASSPDETSGFRTNVGFVNLGAEEIQIRLDLFNGDGSHLGQRRITVEGNGFYQDGAVFQKVSAGTVANGFATVRSDSDGALFFVYASVIDQATGDPVYLPARIGGAS